MMANPTAGSAAASMDIHAILLMSFTGGFGWVVVHFLMKACVFRPTLRALLPQCDADDQDLEEKIPGWCMTTLSGFAMLFGWLDFVSRSKASPWIADWREWHTTHLLPRPWDTVERDLVLPSYMAYFGYVWFGCIRDFHRLHRSHQHGSLPIQDLLMPVHHVLTITLVTLSLYYGMWRGGVLTQLMHLPGTVILHTARIFLFLYGKGRGYFGFNAVLAASTVVVWTATRVLIYGALCVSFVFLYAGQYAIWPGSLRVVSFLLAAGSLLIWALQLPWLYVIVMITRNFIVYGDPKGKARTEEKSFVDSKAENLVKQRRKAR